MKSLITIMFLLASVESMAFTEALKNKMKDMRSNLTGGLTRQCTVYSNTGTAIKTYKGNFDITGNGVRTSFILNDKRIIIKNALVICEEL